MAANRGQAALIAAGGAILLLMLLAAAFSLGVYVGEHGWTREGLTYTGPAAQKIQPPGNLPQKGNPIPDIPTQPRSLPAGLPPGRPEVTGRLRLLTDQILELATAAGPRTILLGAETKYLDENGRMITYDTLKRGDTIAVFGHLVQGDGGQLQADFIVRVSPQ